MEELRNRLKGFHHPSVLVLATEVANEVAEKKNGLLLADMLQPFGMEKEVPFRTPTGTYPLRDFKVKFSGVSELEPISLEHAEAILQNTVNENGPGKELSDMIRDGPEDNEDIARYVKQAKKFKWFSEFRETMARTFQHHQTQMFGQPIAMMFVVSSVEENPLACFEQLCSPHFLSSGFQNGHYDSQIQRLYVLLHDKSDSRSAQVDFVSLVNSLRTQLPPGSFFFMELENNYENRTDKMIDVQKKRADMWGKIVERNFFNTRRRSNALPFGCNITDADMETMRKCMSSVIQSVLIPALETRLFALNDRVTAQRKGFRNTIGRFWRRPGASSNRPGSAGGANDDDGDASGIGGHSGDETTGVRYLHSTIESNIRLLADLSFMVQDYDRALSMYRIARDDFGSDRARLHQGAAYYMMAVCNIMKQNAQRDILDYLRRGSECFQQAIKDVRSAGDGKEKSTQVSWAARFLTNATMLYVEVVLGGGGDVRLYRTVTGQLAQASLEETSLCAAMLLEQTGMFLLYLELSSTGEWRYEDGGTPSRPGLNKRLRKFGFHMVMASHLFKKSGHIDHALRCLATVRTTYQDSRWSHIQDHIDENIGDHAHQLGKVFDALPYWANVLARGKQPSFKQLAIMDDLTRHVAQLGDQAKAHGYWDFDLPKIIDAGIKVHVNQNASILPSLNGQVILPGDVVTVEQPEDGNVPKHARKQTVRSKFLEEEATWKFMKQHLDQCSFRGNAPPPASPTPARGGRRRRNVVEETPKVCYADEPIYVDVPFHNPSSVKLSLSHISLVAMLIDGDGNKHETEKNGECFQIMKLPSITLDENEERMVRLQLIVHMPGTLTILGVKWRLFGIANVKRTFDVQGPKLVDTKENRVANARGIDLRLQKIIKPSAAWLGAELSLDDNVIEGGLYQTELELINLGKKSCSGFINISCNVPALCIGAKTTEIEDRITDQLAPILDDEGTTFELPITDLEQGTPIGIPVCVKIPNLQTTGKVFKLRFLLKYADGEVVRYLRLEKDVMVLPSVHASVQCFPCPINPEEYIMSYSIRNSGKNASSFAINKLSALTSCWKIEMLKGSHVDGQIGPGERKTILFRLKRADQVGEFHQSSILFKEPRNDEFRVADICHTHFATLENARLILASREKARAEYAQMKDRLDAEGKLPVSIQEIRRMNQGLGDGDPIMTFLGNLLSKTKPQEGEPAPSNVQSLCWGPRKQMLHLITEWSCMESGHPGQIESLSIEIYTSNRFTITLDYPRVTTDRAVPVSLTLFNASNDTVEGAELQIDKGVAFSWVGLTKATIPSLLPRSSHQVILFAVFHETGMFDLNTFRICVPPGVDGTAAQEQVFKQSFFIAVHDHLHKPLENAISEKEENKIDNSSSSSLWTEKSDLGPSKPPVLRKQSSIELEEEIRQVLEESDGAGADDDDADDLDDDELLKLEQELANE